MSAITAESIRALLQSHPSLSPLTHLSVTDTSGGCGQAFAVVCVSAAFTDVSMLQRHRMMHNALQGVVERVHAITFKCLTPDKFAAQ